MTRSIICFVFLLSLFLPLISHNVSSEPYGYDEADYMNAASLGFAANWTDTPSIPISNFVQGGLHRDKDGQKGLSERIRGGTDVLFYRHFHGPLFYYLLIPMSRLGWSEHTVRTVLLAIPCASLAIVFFGCLWSTSIITALLAAVLFMSSYSVVASTELAPHQLFALFSLGSLTLLLKALATGRRPFWYGSVVAAGCAFCTLEVGCIVLLTLAICGFVERRRWQIDIRFIAKSLGLLLATVLAIWPAALLRLSVVKACVVMAYLTLFRDHPWGNVNFAETWRSRIFNSPMEWVLILIGVALYVRNRSGIYPLGLCAALMLAATVRVVTVTPRYSLAFVPILDLLAGLALVPSCGSLRRPARFAVVALAFAGLYGSAWYQAAHQPHNPNPRSAAVVTYIHQNALENKLVLVPQADLPTLHYYFPGMRLRGYLGESPAGADRMGFVADAIRPATKP